jgi:tRNA threonylcarbamoyladenosine biosynthesis protein TsaE
MKINSLVETNKLAEVFAKDLTTRGLGKEATVVGLYGDLGSGKTAFTKALAQTLGVTETVPSPTFIIMKSYELEAKSFKFLYHIDAYRLESGIEIEKLGWNDIVKNPENLIIVEWPERIKEVMPENHIRIDFVFVNYLEREITINF